MLFTYVWGAYRLFSQGDARREGREVSPKYLLGGGGNEIKEKDPIPTVERRSGPY